MAKSNNSQAFFLSISVSIEEAYKLYNEETWGYINTVSEISLRSQNIFRGATDMAVMNHLNHSNILEKVNALLMKQIQWQKYPDDYPFMKNHYIAFFELYDAHSDVLKDYFMVMYNKQNLLM